MRDVADADKIISDAETRAYAIYHPDLRGKVDLSNADYHNGPGVSKSSLDKVHQSINHYLFGEFHTTPSMLLGSCVHSMVLEPDLKEFEPVHKSMASKAGKADAQNICARGKIPIPAKQYEQAQRITEAVMDHPIACSLLSPTGDLGSAGQAEQSFFEEDLTTGLLLKCRPDFIIPSAGLIVDLKTTQDASLEWGGFIRSAKKYRYDVQAAFYTDMMTRHYDKKFTFIFVAVETTAPYNVTVCTLDFESLERGRSVYRDDLDKLHNFFCGFAMPHGYSDKLEIISTT